MKLVIVGGVAGGASAAARARRLSEDAQIVLFERGPEVSFANCGLPYYVGGSIAQREKLLVTTAERLRARFHLDVRTRSSVEAVDRAAKSVRVRDLATGREYDESYDKLILAPGAAPVKPPIPGVNLPGICTLRNLENVNRIKTRIDEGVKQAVVVGAGFIGLELVENLVRRGIATTLVELQDQVLPPLDKEMTTPIVQVLAAKGVTVLLCQSAAAFEQDGGDLVVRLDSGVRLPAQLVVLGVGVRPENKLAVDAGLAVGPRGGIRVNEHLRTSDPHIFAVGDAIEVVDYVSGEPAQVPLAGPANRQGRIAADNVFGRSPRYRGTQGTAIVGVFGLSAAMTGASEKTLRRGQRPYRKVYVHPAHHAGYYPGAEAMTLKLLFHPETGRILGAQAVGGAGVDKRIERPGGGDPGGHDRVRPGRDGAGLRAAVRFRQGPGEHGRFRGRGDAAGRPSSARRGDGPRRAGGRAAAAGRCPHTAGVFPGPHPRGGEPARRRIARPVERSAARSPDRHLLPGGPARLPGHPHLAAGRLFGGEHRWRVQDL